MSADPDRRKQPPGPELRRRWNLPGLRQHPRRDSTSQQPNDVVDLYAGDSPAAVWTFDAAVVAAPFRPDIRGPFIQGAPGQRFIDLSWGTVESESTFVMFRRAKLVLADIGAEIIAAAEQSGELMARLGLTDARGQPVRARIKPPAVEMFRQLATTASSVGDRQASGAHNVLS
jgi:hypothetical protein